MREFTLINNIGRKWSLNDTDSFFHNVNGLGQEFKATYEQLGNVFLKSEDQIKQKNITGKIAFSDYQKYEEFSIFIQHKPLLFEYKPEEGMSSYFMKVSIDKLNKKELEDMGLICDVAIKSMGTYYRPIFLDNLEMKEGKKYGYQYDYTYADNAIGGIEISSSSVLESPVKITMIGKCKNPEWKHYLNGELKETGKVFCEIPEGNRLIISTEIPYEIAEYNEKGEKIRNCYEDSDFSTQRFFLLGYGINKIVFSHEAENTLKIVIEGRIEYESV